MATSFGIAVFPDVEELDVVGPLEVLGMWQMWWPEDGATVCTVSQQEGPVRCAHGMRMLPDHTWGTAPPLDVLVYPGGAGTRPQLGDPAIAAWLHGLAAGGAVMTSVCTGALVYADAGLLDGRPATTHWTSLEQLGQLGRDIEVRPDDRYVDDGDVVTAAGVSAGIDMALHLVRRFGSDARAREVRRFMQYDPEPPV